MKRTVYKCDRCGQESNVEMTKFEFIFGRYKDSYHPLGTLNTGHLCLQCEHDLAEQKFYDKIYYWIQNKEK